MPDRDVRFGVAGMRPEEMDSCTKLYFVPFRNAARRLRRPDTAKPAITPAE